jgi:hypothetical protein
LLYAIEAGMNQATRALALVVIAMAAACAAACQSAPSDCGPLPSAAFSPGEVISLSDRLVGGRLRSVNREVTALAGANAVRVAAAPGVGLIWIDGTEFVNGTIEADVCGRDVQAESFVGIAFHRRNDRTYEAVYLRPFNFRSSSPDRRRHAVQYVSMPNDDYARLRQTSPGAFENSVDASAVPTAWNRLRLDVRNGRVQVFVGQANAAALDVRALQSDGRGLVGFYMDNGSDGGFANLRIVRSD